MVSIQFFKIISTIWIQIFFAIYTKEYSLPLNITTRLGSETEILNCVETNIENNLSLFIDKCGMYFENCNDDCIANLDSYNICADNCRNHFLNPTNQFDWECFDVCIYKVEDENFRKLATCIYEPCRSDVKNSITLMMAFLVVIAIFILFAIGCALMRCYKQENSSSQEEIYESYSMSTIR